MDRHLQYLNLASRVAATSQHSRWKMGAVLVRGSNILVRSPNVPRNAPWVMDGEPGASWHAEQAALRRIVKPSGNRAEGCTLYVARVNSALDLRLARPCSACYDYIIACGVRLVVFSLSDQSGYGMEKVVRFS